MAHRFGTNEWALSLKDEINASSEYRNAASNWGVGFNGNMMFAFDADDELQESLRLLIHLAAGQCEAAEFVGDERRGEAGYAAPDADVVKAFNTLNWKTMMEPDESGGPVSVPLAGDSGSAKRKVAKLVEGMGLDPIDLGGIENAHWIEGMLILWINNRYGSTRDSFDFYLRRKP